MTIKEYFIKLELVRGTFYCNDREILDDYLLPRELRYAITQHQTIEFAYDITLDNYGDLHDSKYTYTWINGKASQQFKDYAESLEWSLDEIIAWKEN